MKRKFALFSLLTAVLCGVLTSPVWADVGITSTNFPDSNFRAYITETLDTDGNGSLSDAEIADVEEIDVGGKSITDLTGIAFFTALKRLYCDSNGITTLDVSGCTNLSSLDCHNNVLTTLNVTGLNNLRLLHCYDNLLTGMDVSYFTSLRFLSCHDNLIEELYVNGCTALETLSCGNNRIEYLDVSGCTALETLYCYDNQISVLDVSGCVNLKALRCQNNQLTALDLSSGHPKLELPSFTQTIPGLADAASTGDATYPYQLDLGNNTGVNVADIANIISVDGYVDSTKTATAYDKTTGIARFASRPTSIQYNYDTGFRDEESEPLYMSVTLTGQPLINTEELPVGYVDKSYRYSLSGASASTIHWSWSGTPTLPEGLDISEYAGSIRGTPKGAGTYNITLTATAGTQSTSRTLTLVIKPASEVPTRPTITTVTADMPTATKGVPYAKILEATGTKPIKWSLYSGELPHNLKLSESGIISGTPDTVEKASFVVMVSNDVGESTRTLRITVSQTSSNNPDYSDYSDTPSSNKSTSSGSSGGCSAGFGALGLALGVVVFLKRK